MRIRLVPVLAVAALLSACGGDAAVPELTAEPVVPPTAPAPTEPSPTETDGSPGPTDASPTPTESESRPPTDTDRARFVTDYRPAGAEDLEHVAQDLDGDGVEELVFAYVRSAEQVARVDVAWWDGAAYEVLASSDAGPASRIDRLRVRDVNADGVTEIVTYQSAARSAASVTVWAVRGRGALVGLVADGGCNEGRFTYGIIGASLEDRDADGAEEIYATCDGSPLPESAWTTDRYVWRDGAYRYEPDTIE